MGDRQNKQVKWDSLNKRQQRYMEIIFDLDQGLERYYRLPPTQRPAWDNPPASVWRWLPFDKGLSRLLGEAGLRDEGTGSTFEALERRGLIESSAQGVMLSNQGRALVRNAKGVQAYKAPKPGTLQEWHWRALVCVSQTQGANSVEFYRGIGTSTIRRLEDYKVNGEIKPLIAWVELPCEPWVAQDFHYRPYTRTTRNVRRLTDFGQQYYRENWLRYRELYPNIPAPAPDKESL